MLYAAAAFACGIGLGPYAWRPPYRWIFASVGLAACALCLVRKRVWVPRVVSLVILGMLGALNIQLRPPDVSNVEILRYAGNDVELIAHVTDPGPPPNPAAFATTAGAMPRDGIPERDLSRRLVTVETESIAGEDGPEPIGAGVRLNLYSKQGWIPDIPYGTRLRVTAKLHAPRNFGNPGAFDYEGYLHSKGIVALASANAESLRILPGFSGSRLEALRNRIHRSVIDHVHQLWTPGSAALIDAMVIGEDAFIDPDTRADFQRSGTYHILVVSGMNLAILVLVIFWILRRWRVHEATVNLAAITVAITYAFLTDTGAPIWRATLMLALYLAARFLYRERSMLNAIGVAAFGLLIIDPGALLSPSFQLTFLAVLIIAAIGVPILERTSQPYLRGLRSIDVLRYDAQLPPRVAQFRLDLRLIASRFAPLPMGRLALSALTLCARATLSAYELLFISAVMQAGLALPMAFYFHRATSMGLPANLAVVPLTALLMPFAVAAVALSYISARLAMPFAWIAALALRGITSAVTLLGGPQVADIRVPTPSAFVIVGSAAALILAGFTARRRKPYALAGLAALAVSALTITAIPPRPALVPRTLEVTAIDVGQGDSTLIVSPEGRTLLVDAGGLPHWMHSSFDVGEQVVSPYLWSRRIHRLDAVAVTHAHADHMGGMSAILANFRPRELWLGVDTPSRDLQRLLAEARELSIKVVPRHAGDNFLFGTRTQVRILAPQRDPATLAWRANDDSLVMKISYGESSVLLEGDAERPVEERIALEQPEATLLKVAHHGSATSTSASLLSAVHPRYAFISVGARNTYGHPRREVLARLQDAHAATYRTDVMGAVTFYLDGRRVTPFLPARR